MSNEFTCPLCGNNLIKIAGSYKSCINKNCSNYYNFDDYNRTYIDYFYYEDELPNEFKMLDNVHDDYFEEYDEYLFFYDNPHYLKRLDFRKNNDFAEDYLFKYAKKHNFDRFLNGEDINNLMEIKTKYIFLDDGRDLEKQNSKMAFDYYESLKNDYRFKNDYYIYKKLVKLCDDYEKQLQLIYEFFNSGIYCNRYHYLWFLKKLHFICEKIPVSEEIINNCLINFKNKGFKNKDKEDTPVFLSEKITKNNGEIKVFSDKQYIFRQLIYEFTEEISQLYHSDQYEYIVKIYAKLLNEFNSNSMKFYQGICVNYHRLGEYENEIKWIYSYLNGPNRYKNKDEWFTNRLYDLGVDINYFHHSNYFFDNNKYYLDKDDFKDVNDENFEIKDYFNSLKDKYLKIEKGLKLEKNPKKAINYYSSLLDDVLFENDYYPYKSLVILYDQIGDYENEIDTIFSFFNSNIYCDRFNYLFFIYHLKKLYSEYLIDYEEIDYYLKSFKDNGFKNQKFENTPLPLAERIFLDDTSIKILPGQDYLIKQNISAFNLEIDMYKSYGMLSHMNKIYKILIKEYYNYEAYYYKELCYNYREMNDYDNELKTINKFLENDRKISQEDRSYFKHRYVELKELIEKNDNVNIMEDPKIEIFFENNENYLTFEDFKNNQIDNTELLDKIRLKYAIIFNGWKIDNDYEKASQYYTNLLSNDLFKNDYYIYRRLVMLYSNFGEYELVYETIKKFFNSGIYCNRYQYLWFLHKLAIVSLVKFISNDEISDMLKAFKMKGFKNQSFENNPVLISDRLRRNLSSVMIKSTDYYDDEQKKYEQIEEVSQLEINGIRSKSTEILRDLFDEKDFKTTKDYMRLCYSYHDIGDYESEKELIEEYLSKNDYSKEWFEKRYEELDDLRNK